MKSAHSRTKKTKKPVRTRKTKGSFKTYKNIFLLFILGISSLGIIGVSVVSNVLNQKFASADSSTSYSILEDATPSLLYIVVDDITSERALITKANFIVYDRQNKKVTTFNIPVAAELDVPGKFGEEQFSKLFALGNLNATTDKYVDSISLIKQAVFKLFGYKVDGYIISDSTYQGVIDAFLEKGSLSGLVTSGAFYALNTSLFTDLHPSVLFNLSKFIGSLPSERLVSTSFAFDDAPTDTFFRELTYESALAKSSQSIAVLNGSGTPGLAGFGSRVLRNMGGRIVAVDNSTQQYSESVLITAQLDEVSTLVARVFGIKKVVTKDESTFSEAAELLKRADLVVIMGFDISDRL